MDPEERLGRHPRGGDAEPGAELPKLFPDVEAPHQEEERRITEYSLRGALEERDLMAAHPVIRNIAGAPHQVPGALAAHERDPERLQPPDKPFVKLSDLKLRERVRILLQLPHHALPLFLRKGLKLQRGGIA